MRTAMTAALLALPLPALAQGVPHSCRLVQQCSGSDCRDNPGVTLMFQATADGLISWDQSLPETRVELTALPGAGIPAWVGRAPELDGTVLMSLPEPGTLRVAIHSARAPGIVTATGECRADAPPPLSK